MKAVALAALIAIGAPRAALASGRDDAALTTAIDHFADRRGVAGRERQSVRVDLNGDDRKDAVVLLTSKDWCGTGGCTLLVFKNTGRGFSVIGWTSTVRPPIRLLPTRSHGWRDLSVWQVGGGEMTGFTASLIFNGSRYRKGGQHLPASAGRVLIAPEQPRPETQAPISP